MANYPGFDPKKFNKDFDVLCKDPSNPLLNRAISGIYPPGSVFKMLTTIAALEEGAKNHTGVVVVDGSMVDKPMEIRARTILAQAEAAGILKGGL